MGVWSEEAFCLFYLLPWVIKDGDTALKNRILLTHIFSVNSKISVKTIKHSYNSIELSSWLVLFLYMSHPWITLHNPEENNGRRMFHRIGQLEESCSGATLHYLGITILL